MIGEYRVIPGVNYEDYIEAYEMHVAELQDSWKHKRYLLNSDRCFYEWVNEQIEGEANE